MKNETEHRKKLYIQIRESYGRIVYSYTTHLKRSNHLHTNDQCIRVSQIVLSAISTGGFLGAIVSISNQQIFTVIGGLFSTVLLALNLYSKNYSLLEEIKRHQNTAIDLWKIREDYISLLTDFQSLPIETIISKRDALQNTAYEIYKSSPLTDRKSYIETQKALKFEEEQFFTHEEIDKILPTHLRIRDNQNHMFE